MFGCSMESNPGEAGARQPVLLGDGAGSVGGGGAGMYKTSAMHADRWLRVGTAWQPYMSMNDDMLATPDVGGGAPVCTNPACSAACWAGAPMLCADGWEKYEDVPSTLARLRITAAMLVASDSGNGALRRLCPIASAAERLVGSPVMLDKPCRKSDDDRAVAIAEADCVTVRWGKTEASSVADRVDPLQ